MAVDDLISSAPKSFRPTLWILAFGMAVALVVLGALSVVTGAARTAAAIQVQSTKDKLEADEKGNDKQWNAVATKLDAIQAGVNATDKHVAAIDQWITDQQSDSAFAGPRHKRTDR